MSTARVHSVDAIEDFKVALALFRDDATQALSMIDLEVRRSVDWLVHQQPAYWQAETRKRWELVGRAKDDLQKCRTFKAMEGYTPACTDEKKALEKAQRRLRQAEIHLAATKRWSRDIQHEVNEFEGRLSQLTSLLEGDMPKSIAVLENILRSLDSYLQVTAPAADQPAEEPQSVANPAGGDEKSAAGETATAEPAAAIEPGKLPSQSQNNSTLQAGGA